MSNSGLVFKVAKSSGGVQLEAKEWYPCVLKSITPCKKTWQGVEENALRWEFELQGEDYQLEYNGEVKQFTVRGKTSLFTTPKSKMYGWYTELIGAELEEDSEMNLENVIGVACDVMVKPREYVDPKTKKNRTAYDIEMIRRAKAQTPKVTAEKVIKTPPVTPKEVVKAPTKAVKQAQNPDGVETPEDIDFEQENASPKAEVASPDAIFKGIL